MLFTIRGKILAILSATAIVSAGVAAFIGYQTARHALEREAFDRLTAVREMKAAQVEDYIEGITNQVITSSGDLMIVDAMRAFRDVFRQASTVSSTEQARVDEDLRAHYDREFLPRLNENREEPVTLSTYWPADPGTRVIQHRYIVANRFDTGSKHLLDDPGDGSRYSQFHRLYHPILRDFLERFGYYDLFLVDAETGHIVYSVFKEVDYGTSLVTGPYRETNIARAFLAARDGGTPDFVRLQDFASYPPSYDAQASFIASPIYDGDERIGVLIFQMPVERLNDIMTSRQDWSSVGLGTSGETYIVGGDFRLRNQSRFLIEDRVEYLRLITELGVPDATIHQIDNLNSTIGLQEVRTAGTSAALSGETGTMIFPDYRGIEVLSAYRPLGVGDVRWVIMSEIDAAEAFASATTLRNRTLLLLVVIGFAILAVAASFARSLTRPIHRLSRTAGALAGGDLDTLIDVEGHDEIADLARSFASMRDALRDLVHRQANAIEALSTPLIPLQDDVVVVPLVGDLDEHRVERLRESLTSGLHEGGYRIAIIDLTGVPAIDPPVADRLARVASTGRLLGAQIIFTGMQASTAAALADLDVRLDAVTTARSLQDGILIAMRHVGRAP